jgi:hypothetical protein
MFFNIGNITLKMTLNILYPLDLFQSHPNVLMIYQKYITHFQH